MGDQPSVSVVHSHVDDSNPFFQLLVSHLPAHVESRRFSWRLALFGKIDVLHLHWPERLIRGRHRGDTLRKRALTLLLLVRLRLRAQRHATAVIRTLHNELPHDPPSWVERRLLRGLDRATTLWIYLSAPPRATARRPHMTIPHGSYEGAYDFETGVRPVPDRMLYFGRIRPYKGVEELLENLSGQRPPFELRIVGRPTSADLAARLETLVSAIPGSSRRWEFLSEDELVREIQEAQVICLPYRDMGNSGALLLALTAGRAVIVPDSPTNAAIAREVGEEWVVRYRSLSAADLATAWTTASAACGLPDLSKRRWADLSEEYSAAYAWALARAREDVG